LIIDKKLRDLADEIRNVITELKKEREQYD
jgi:hypothetical protein